MGNSNVSSIHGNKYSDEPDIDSSDDKRDGDSKGGGSGSMGKMEERLAAVEKSIIRLEAVLPTLATKADVHQATGELTRWIVGTGVAGIVLFVTLMTFVLNNAAPKAAPAAQAAPVIVTVPAAPVPAPSSKP